MKYPAKAARAGERAQKATAAAAKASLQLFKRALEAQSLGRLADAETLYNAALKHDPRHLPALLNLPTLLRMQGRLAEAQALAERAAAAAPDEASAHFALGVTFRQRRRDQEAPSTLNLVALPGAAAARR